MEFAAVVLSSGIETSNVSILPEEVINQENDFMKYIGLVLAFENFTKTDNLDSFLELGFDEEIETARYLLSKDQSKIAKIKGQFLEVGDCLRNELNKENVSVEKLDSCEFGEDLQNFLKEVDRVQEISKSTTHNEL